jgi:hypothetical protein
LSLIQINYRKLSALFVASTILLASSIAEGAETHNTVVNVDARISQEAITSSVLLRADVEIQIRRIKNFMASKNSDAENEIEQLEKLQKVFHSQN